MSWSNKAALPQILRMSLVRPCARGFCVLCGIIHIWHFKMKFPENTRHVWFE